MDKPVATSKVPQIKFISKRSDDYKLEFINGAISNITPRGEIVCDFHLESKERPTEQSVGSVAGDGTATLSPFKDTGIFTRDVKFGIVINASFAKDLVILLNNKIPECEAVIAEMAKAEAHK
jgi:hypothetical protein